MFFVRSARYGGHDSQQDSLERRHLVKSLVALTCYWQSQDPWTPRQVFLSAEHVAQHTKLPTYERQMMLL